MRSVPLLLVLLLCLGCSTNAPISGKITLDPDGIWESKVYLIRPKSLFDVAASFTGEVLDSAILAPNGSFTFSKLPIKDSVALLELAVQKKGEKYPNRLLNDGPSTANYMPLVWKQGELLKIEATADDFQRSFNIMDPSPENSALLQLRDIKQQAYVQWVHSGAMGLKDETQLLEREAGWRDYQQPMMDFANTTQAVLPALVALRWVDPLNDYERIPEFLVAQCEKWLQNSPSEPWVEELCHRADRARLPILLGDALPDLSMPMKEGDSIKLSKLLGKRLTVLDVWASWCAPCRKENRDILAPLYQKWHGEGFQIVGYGLETSADAWEKAILMDGANHWPNASHLMGDRTPFMQALRIKTIPANFVLDARGKVLAKNIHGEALRQFVEDYLGKHHGDH